MFIGNIFTKCQLTLTTLYLKMLQKYTKKDFSNTNEEIDFDCDDKIIVMKEKLSKEDIWRRLSSWKRTTQIRRIYENQD